VYVFNESVFEAVNNIKPSWRNELEIVDAVQYLVDHGKNVIVRSVQDWWKDTGKPEDLLEANQLILQDLSTSIEGSIDDASGIVGNVSIGKGTRIESSRIRGPVIIGNNCEIGSNTYLGPYTSIGDDCRIVGAEIENSIVMDGAMIDCGNRIVDSIIGKNSKITSNGDSLPKGMKFVVGDSTYLSL
jgi:glucose-1-phosphate thymidylyltransferase